MFEGTSYRCSVGARFLGFDGMGMVRRPVILGYTVTLDLVELPFPIS